MVTQNPFVQYGKEIWWMILIRGIFGVIFGIIALVWPGITVVAWFSCSVSTPSPTV